MTFRNVADNAETRALFGQLNNLTDPVTFTVDAGDGAKFPAGDFWVTVWDDKASPNPNRAADREVLLVTDRNGDDFTALRAQQGTAAAAHPGTPAVRLHIMAGHIAELNAAVAALQAGGSAINLTHDTFTGDGTPGPYALSAVPNGALFFVFVNGMSHRETDHWTLSGGNLTFTSNIDPSDEVDVYFTT